MNTFKRGDSVKWRGGVGFTVTKTDSCFVYNNGAAYYYSDCTFISNPEIISLLQAGKKFEAIKLYRTITGLGLKEAKDAVEVLDAGLPQEQTLGDILSIALKRRAESLYGSTIVVRYDIGKGYRPNDKPVVHNSLTEATKEAERLAKANPGVRFDTFTLATSSIATAPVVTTVSA